MPARDPNRPVVMIVSNVKPPVWKALKILAKANRTTLDKLVAGMLEADLTRLGVDVEFDKKASPQVIEKVEAPEVQGPPSSVHAARLDPSRFVRG